MDAPYNGASGRTSLEATTVWCGGCGIWFGSNVYRTIDAETDGALINTFLTEGYGGLNTCVCPSCSWRHIAEEPIAIHLPQKQQFLLYIPASRRHRAQMIRTEFLASVATAPGVHVPRYVFEPVLVGSRTELKQLIGDVRSISRLEEDDYSSLETESVDGEPEASVAKRSQTLNLLAELVGEEEDAQILNVAPGSAIADRETEPLSVAGLEESVEIDDMSEPAGRDLDGDASANNEVAETKQILSDRDTATEMSQPTSDSRTEEAVMESDPPSDHLAESSRAEEEASSPETQIDSLHQVVDEADESIEDQGAFTHTTSREHGDEIESAPTEFTADSVASGEGGAESPKLESVEIATIDEADFAGENESDAATSQQNTGGDSIDSPTDEAISESDSVDKDVQVDAEEMVEVVPSSQDTLDVQREETATDAEGSLESASQEGMGTADLAYERADDEPAGIGEEADENSEAEPAATDDAEVAATASGSYEVAAVALTDAERQPMISGSVELAADYSQELAIHSQPPAPYETSEVEMISVSDELALETQSLPGTDSATPEGEAVKMSTSDIEGTAEHPMLDPQDMEGSDPTDSTSDVELATDKAAPELSDGVWLTEEGVVLRQQLTVEQMERLYNQKVRVVPQLHDLGEGKVCTLSLLGVEGEGELPIFWALIGEERESVLSQLAARFAVRLDLYSELGEGGLVADYTYPLEENVAAMQRRLEDASLESEEAAKSLLSAADFTVGLTHNFHQESFVNLESASDARLALGIVEFWSDPKRTNHLWARMGFPLDWWHDIQSRVFRRAYEAGLPVASEHLELTLATLDLESEKQYVSNLIDHFLEVCLRIRPGGLDIVQVAGVWDQLLSRAQTLEIDVDGEVEALASQAMDEAEMALEDEGDFTDESLEAIEISLADAMEVASIGGVDVTEYAILNRPTGSMVAPNMAEKTSEELVGVLVDSSQRLAATLTLLARRDLENVEPIHESISAMEAEELCQLLPAILPLAGEFAGFFRGGLFSDEHVQRLAAAALLVEHRDERVINPILAMILDPEEDQWSALALCAAQFGTAVGKPALSRVSIDADSTDRIAYLLAAIEIVSPGALDLLDADIDDASASECIEAARRNGAGFDASFAELPFEERVTELLNF